MYCNTSIGCLHMALHCVKCSWRAGVIFSIEYIYIWYLTVTMPMFCRIRLSLRLHFAHHQNHRTANKLYTVGYCKCEFVSYVSEYDNRTPLKLVAILIPTVLGFVLVSVLVAAIVQAKRKRAGKTECVK